MIPICFNPKFDGVRTEGEASNEFESREEINHKTRPRCTKYGELEVWGQKLLARGKGGKTHEGRCIVGEKCQSRVPGTKLIVAHPSSEHTNFRKG